jgi:UDPglucose--hexose-1-phosphate uridylyltransferase
VIIVTQPASICTLRAMKKLGVDRTDGRYVYVYAFDRDLPEIIAMPDGTPAEQQIELRWNAVLGEWVIVSTARQDRTFLPPDEHCPLCPTASEVAFPTEIPVRDFEIAVFENRWPSFVPSPASVSDESPVERRARAAGACEVVVYSAEHAGTLTGMTQAQVRRLVDVWADRYEELAARADVKYVFIFENRGKEIGVTLTHPHGQIYAFPYVPPRVAREHETAASHAASTGRCLQCDLLAEELSHGRRIVAEAKGFAAYVPFAARVPYEVHVAATAHRASLLDLGDGERDGLASILREVQAIYDGLWDREMPYTMSMHQASTDGVERAGEHLHIEFLPPYRTRDKLKYLAGVETGAGTFINDASPEVTAAELRDAAGRIHR